MSRCYNFSIEAKKFWLILIPIFIAFGVLSFGLGYIIVDKVLMPNVTNLSNKGEVEVPVIKGLDNKVASQKLYNLGLRLMVSGKEYDEEVGEGTILSQDPLAGKKVKRGRHISVILSRGSEVGEIPSVKTLSEGPAKTALRKSGFSNIVVKNVYNSSIDKGNTIGTIPEWGVKTSRTADLTLLISKGEKPTHTTVPNLVGEMLSTSRERIDSVGLFIGHISYEKSTIMGPGHIINQSIAPGTSVKLESKVDIVVSTAK